MPVTTLRPNATVAESSPTMFKSGGASCHAILSDNASSYVGASGSSMAWCTEEFPDLTLTAGEVTRSVRIGLNAKATSAASKGGRGVVTLTSGGVTVATLDTTWTTSAATKYSAAAPLDIGQAALNSVRVKIEVNKSQNNPITITAAELYLEVTTALKPTAAVSCSGTINVTTATGSITHTPGTNGGAQAWRQIKVFTNAVKTGGGFNPATSPAVYDSGEEATGSDSFTLADLPAGTLWVYGRSAQSINNRAHWSDWAGDAAALIVSLTTSEVSTVTAAANSAAGRIDVTVTRNTGTDPWLYVDLQQSTTGGASWVPVDGATSVVPGANSVTIPDHDAQPGVSTLYRARAVKAGPVNGAWVTSTAAMWTISADTMWIKSPTAPALNYGFRYLRRPLLAARSRQQITAPLLTAPGDTVARRVVSFGPLSRREATIDLWCETFLERDKLVALAASGPVVIQCPAEWGWPAGTWLMGAPQEADHTMPSGEEWRPMVVPIIEVD